MKYSTKLLVLFLIVLTFNSCQSEEEKNAEILTKKYVRLVDSITNKNALDAMSHWPGIEQYFEKKTNEINVEIDKLDDNHDFDARIDSATAKYERFRNKIILQKVNLQKEVQSTSKK